MKGALAEPLQRPAETAGDALIHTVCCDETRALCGKDVSSEPWVADAAHPNDCVVCEELVKTLSPCRPDCPRRVVDP